VHKYPFFLGIFLASSLALIPCQAIAGAFRVVPTRVTLDAQTKTAKLTVINTGAEQVTIQVEGMVWRQDAEGRDEYSEAKELAFFPKIFSMAANEERIVRLGYQGAWPVREQTYRVYVQELPVAKPGETALKMVLRLGVPVFVKPAKETQGNTVEIAQVALREAHLQVRVKNNGSSHFMAQTIKASGRDGAGTEVFARETAGWYVLPGISKPFPLAISAPECLKAKIIHVAVEGGPSSLGTTMDVDRAMCAQLPESISTPASEGRQ
jgi:fimbrial chaperone protein